MAEDKEDREEGGFHNQNPNPNHNNNNNISKKGSQGKSCKGCLYYSSLQRSKSKNPTCVGIPRTLHQGQSLYNPFFLFLDSLILMMMLVGLFGRRENQGNLKENSGFSFLCCVCLLKSDS